MKHLPILLLLVSAFFVSGTLHAQKKKKITTQKTALQKLMPASETGAELPKEGSVDTSAPKMVTITSAFKPFLKDAAKLNFTAATPVIDSSRIPVLYSIPSKNLFFTYQPVAIKPLALAVDSGYTWANDQYIKLGAGNFSSYYGEAAFSFGDGKNSITNVRGNFLTATGHLPAQQSAKWGVDVLSVFNTKGANEWTTHPFYQSSTQYLYGYQPSTLNYAKDDLLQQFTTVGIEAGMQNKVANLYDITYHPKISFARFFDNRSRHENTFLIKAPINKSFGKVYAFDLGITADMSTLTIPLLAGSHSIQNNLYYIDPSFQFHTPTVKINLGIRPSWDNKAFSLLPNFTAEAKVTDINLVFQAGWVGSFQKNSFRSLAGFNPWISLTDTAILNTKIGEQFVGVKGNSGDHFTYQVKASLQKLNNQPLFLNNIGDGKTFKVLFEPQMNAVRLHGELGYTEQEKFSFTAGATFTQYSSLQVNQKAWGLVPAEATASLKWKILKDLQVKADAFLWDGAPYRDSTLTARKGKAVADLNLGVEFTVMPRLNLWLQMNNLLNSTYQRWNQYTVLGFNVLGGVVYSFR
jgi:hypothetical protein